MVNFKNEIIGKKYIDLMLSLQYILMGKRSLVLLKEVGGQTKEVLKEIEEQIIYSDQRIEQIKLDIYLVKLLDGETSILVCEMVDIIKEMTKCESEVIGIEEIEEKLSNIEEEDRMIASMIDSMIDRKLKKDG
jgi:hypothetical protein